MTTGVIGATYAPAGSGTQQTISFPKAGSRA